MLEALALLVVLLILVCCIYMASQYQGWKRYNGILANGGLPPITLEEYRVLLIERRFDTHF